MPVNSRYTWNLDRLQFRDTKTGRWVPPRRVLGHVNKVLASSELRIGRLADAARNGIISPDTFITRMRAEVKTLHVATAIAANGGLSQMTPKRWGQVGGRLRREFGYLNGFSADLQSGHLPLTSGRVRSRAKSYSSNAHLEYWKTVDTRMVDSGRQIEAKRSLGPVSTEHCGGCVGVAEVWVPLEKLRPIGVMECKWFCRCTVVHRLGPVAKLTPQGATQLENRVEQSAGPNASAGINASELTVRERAFLDRLTGGTRLKQVDLSNSERHLAARLAQRGELVKEKVEGKFVYYLKSDVPRPPVPPVVPPVVPPPGPGPLIQPFNKLTTRQLDVFNKVVTAERPLTIKDLTPAEAKIARALVRKGELTKGPTGKFFKPMWKQVDVVPPVIPRVGPILDADILDLTSQERALLRRLQQHRYINSGGVLSQFNTDIAQNPQWFDRLIARGLVEKTQSPVYTEQITYRAVIGKADLDKVLAAAPTQPLPAEGFKTIAALEDWAERKYYWMGTDFAGLDLRAANELIQEFDYLATKYPAVAKRLRYIGSQKTDWKVSGYLDFKPHAFRGNSYAHAYMEGTANGKAMGFNPEWFNNYAKAQRSIAQDVRNGWHPRIGMVAGPDNEVRSVLTHEFGHLTDGYLQSAMGRADAFDHASFSIRDLVDEFHASNYGTRSTMVKVPGRFELESRGTPLDAFRRSPTSNYGLNNREEAWAEGFAAIRWTDPSDLTMYSRRQQALLEWIGDETKWARGADLHRKLDHTMDAEDRLTLWLRVDSRLRSAGLEDMADRMEIGLVRDKLLPDRETIAARAQQRQIQKVIAKNLDQGDAVKVAEWSQGGVAPKVSSVNKILEDGGVRVGTRQAARYTHDGKLYGGGGGYTRGVSVKTHGESGRMTYNFNKFNVTDADMETAVAELEKARALLHARGYQTRAITSGHLPGDKVFDFEIQRLPKGAPKFSGPVGSGPGKVKGFGDYEIDDFGWDFEKELHIDRATGRRVTTEEYHDLVFGKTEKPKVKVGPLTKEEKLARRADQLMSQWEGLDPTISIDPKQYDALRDPGSKVGKQFTDLLNKLPSHKATAYRGTALSEKQLAEMQSKLRTGKPIKLPGHSSFTTNRSFAESALAENEIEVGAKQYTTVFRAKVKSGKNLADHEDYNQAGQNDEDELILRAGSRFRIIKVKVNKAARLVEIVMEEI